MIPILPTIKFDRDRRMCIARLREGACGVFRPAARELNM